MNQIHNPLLLKELEECRVKPFADNLPDPPPLLSYKNKSIFTRGNISTIIGPPKCGKTMILSFLAAACMEPQTIDPNFASDCKFPEILYFDTEQSQHHAKKCIERICRMISNNEENPNLNAFGLRNKSIDQRVKLIEFGISHYKTLSLVIIDGIADLVESYNDEKQSSDITNKLMTLSHEYDCHICTVIHINKSSKEPKGHLGASLKQKSENVFLIDKKSNQISLKAQVSRDVETPLLNFMINQDGLPILTGQ